MTLVRPRKAGSAHAAIARMVDQCGSLQDVSNYTGISVSTVQRWTIPKEDDKEKKFGGEMSFVRLCQVAERFQATAPVEHLALLLGGIFVPLPEAERNGEWGVGTAKSAASYAEIMRGIAESLCPNSHGGRQVTAREAAKLVPTIDEGLSALAALRGLALRAAEGRD